MEAVNRPLAYQLPPHFWMSLSSLTLVTAGVCDARPHFPVLVAVARFSHVGVRVYQVRQSNFFANTGMARVSRAPGLSTCSARA